MTKKTNSRNILLSNSAKVNRTTMCSLLGCVCAQKAFLCQYFLCQYIFFFQTDFFSIFFDSIFLVIIIFVHIFFVSINICVFFSLACLWTEGTEHFLCQPVLSLSVFFVNTIFIQLLECAIPALLLLLLCHKKSGSLLFCISQTESNGCLQKF